MGLAKRWIEPYAFHRQMTLLASWFGHLTMPHISSVYLSYPYRIGLKASRKTA